MELDACVAVKIEKYSRESSLGLSGALLGVVREGKVLVNNCYPLPKIAEIRGDTGDDSERLAEIEKQRDVGRRLMEGMQHAYEDITTVGWYQSTHLGNYINNDNLKNQYHIQAQSPHCICIIFDVSLAGESLKAFRAVRLTTEAMRVLAPPNPR